MRKKPTLGRQIYPSYISAALLAMAITFYYLSDIFSDAMNTQSEQYVKAQALLVERLFQGKFEASNGPEIDSILKDMGRQLQYRVTVAMPDGRVLGDSQEDVSRIHNFALRPEIKEAITGKASSYTRHSFISDFRMTYIAMPYKQGDKVVAIIRAALPAADTNRVAKENYRRMGFAALIALSLASLIGLYVSRQIARPIREIRYGADKFSEGSLDYRLSGFETQEFSSLAQDLNSMAAQFKSKLSDVTQERNELEAVLSSMMEAVIVLDNSERILSLNQAAENLFGISNERVRGRTVQEAIRNTDLHKFVSKALAGNTPMEGDIVFRSDPERFVQAHGATLQDAQSRNIGVLVVLNDVTRLKTLENIRKDFVANVSHELKTPITSIKGFLETLKEGAMDDPENANRFLNIIMKHTDRLDSIIEDLLSLSRIERDAEKGEIALERGSIGDVVDSVIKACNRKAQLRGNELRPSVDPELTAKINARLLEQAIVNLVDNAVKYSAPGTPVEIEAKSVDGEIAIKVKDQGCGISREHLTRIFERFYRVDKARSRNVGGTGLGLSIVKHIVNAHGGRISVESSPNKGSAFIITLPGDGPLSWSDAGARKSK
jgi:two-component system, OmpR family, phosphate regulon sensor histidine kinase PhoR